MHKNDQNLVSFEQVKYRCVVYGINFPTKIDLATYMCVFSGSSRNRYFLSNVFNLDHPVHISQANELN